MTTLIRRVPVFEVPTFGRLFNNLLNDQFFDDMKACAPAAATAGTLAVDVSEDDKSILVRASLPGFKKEEVSVEVHDGVLSINAQHVEEKEETGERFYRRERRVGSLARRLALPSTVQETNTQAELKDGVLTLRLPKIEKEQPKKIKIN